MGQICIAKEYRGQGLVNIMYKTQKTFYQQNLDLLITEIATCNQRSMRAHERVELRTIHISKGELDEWAVVGGTGLDGFIRNPFASCISLNAHNRCTRFNVTMKATFN